MTTRTRTLITALAGALLASGCATTAHRSSSQRHAESDVDVTASAGLPFPRISIEIMLNTTLISSGEGTWLGPNLAATSLSAVNDVPPTGEIVAIVGGKRLPASMWVGGNFSDSDAALIYVHHQVGEAPATGAALCEAVPTEVTSAGQSLRMPVSLKDPIGTADAALPNGAGVFGDNCLAGVITTGQHKDHAPTVTPFSVLSRLKAAIPSPERVQ